MLRKLFLIFVTLTILTFTFPCKADPPSITRDVPIVTPVIKGQMVPYSGVLLSPEAVAKIITDAQECSQRIKIEIDHARDVQKALDDKKLADIQADIERDKKIFQAGITSRDGQIKDLSLALQKSENSRNNNWVWVAGGVLAGALLTVGTVAIVGYVK